MARLELLMLITAEYTPGAAGIPDTSPESADRFNPGGRDEPVEGIQFQAYGGAPPLASKETPRVPP